MKFLASVLAAALIAMSSHEIHAAYAVKTTYDVVYAKGQVYGGEIWKITLNSYEPVGAPATGKPALIFVHGGGWAGNEHTAAAGEDTCEYYASQGYVAFAIKYRLDQMQAAGGIPHAAYVDTKAAVRFVRRYAAYYGINANRVAVMGPSAGGFNVATTGYSTSTSYLQDPGVDPNVDFNNPSYSSRPDAVIVLWGGVGGASGGNANFDATDPPIMIVHGTADGTVNYSNGVNLQNTCLNAGISPVEFFPVAGGDHSCWTEFQTQYGKHINVAGREFLDTVMTAADPDPGGDPGPGPGGSDGAPDPVSVGYVDEPFTVTVANDVLYKPSNVTQQVVARMAPNRNTPGYYWGFFGAAGITGTDGVLVDASHERISFSGRTRLAGSRAYTRFQVGEGVESFSFYDKSSAKIDASAPDYGAVIVTHNVVPNATGTGATRLAVLVRTADGWFQSSDREILTAQTAYTYPFSGLDWRQVNTAAGTPGADMDEVDFLNEAPLSYTNNLGQANPNFAEVLGMGLVFTGPTANDPPSGALQITRMYVGDVLEPAPSNVRLVSAVNKITVSWDATSSAATYDVLRSETSGSGYAPVATGLTLPSFEDSTVTNGVTYYYMVRAKDGAFSATEKRNPVADNVSADSAEVSVTAGAVSGANHWTRY